jgi:hypothetical protein
LHGFPPISEQIEQRFPIPWNAGVDVHEVRDAGHYPISHAGDDHPTIAVPDQHDLSQILILQDVHHILYVPCQVSLRGCEMDALTQAGERRRVDFMPRRVQEWGDLLPTPAAVPCLKNENKHGHPCPP